MPEIWTQNPQVANSEYRYCGTCGYNETRVKEITDATSLVQGESIVINVSDTTDATSTTLSAGTVNVLADAVSSNDVAANSVTVSLGPTTSVTYDATAVSVINNAVGNAEENTTTVTLVVENNPNLDCGMDAGMTPEQQATIINAAGAAEYDTDDSTIPDANTTPVTVYSITLEVTTGSGTTEISDFNGGSATVTVPYTEEVGENETVSVVRVETDGTTTPMNDASYDAEDRTVTWTTESHSYYMITRETASTPVPDPAPDPTPDPAPDPTPDPTPTPDPGDSGSSAPPYRTSVVAGENGTVTVSPKNAEKGDQVTITVKPDEGYELDELTVTDAKGNDLTLTDKGSGKYTFKMPASKVTVSVSFAEIEPEPVQPVELPFIDVADNAWYADAVRYVYEKGLMGGSGSAETFQPEQSITRGMLVTILYRLEGEPNTGASAFTDVIPGVWYANAVAWASASGIVNGYNGAFRPEDALTRQDMAAILYRYAGYKGYDRSVGENTNILSYTDALAVSEYAIPAMQWACGSGLIEGANGALTPTGDATRAAAATILMRFCENAAK